MCWEVKCLSTNLFIVNERKQNEKNANDGGGLPNGRNDVCGAVRCNY